MVLDLFLFEVQSLDTPATLYHCIRLALPVDALQHSLLRSLQPVVITSTDTRSTDLLIATGDHRCDDRVLRPRSIAAPAAILPMDSIARPIASMVDDLSLRRVFLSYLHVHRLDHRAWNRIR